MSAKKTSVKKAAVTLAYKGFDQSLACRGYQYEVGKTYEHEGPVSVCNQGFHSCEYPLHVLRYYNGAKSRFAVVEVGGEISRKDDGDSKLASSKLTVKTEINLAGLIKAAVEYTLSRAVPVKGATSKKDKTVVSVQGEREIARASGDYGAATASGDSGAATASGDSGAATASGNYGAATASGDSGAATASGNYGAATASGDYGAATASGDSGAATASGYSGAATASGNYGAATASGYSGAATASGNYGAATASGRNGKARGKEGCALFLVYRDANQKTLHAKAAIVGQAGIKPDIWYRLNASGDFVEAK